MSLVEVQYFIKRYRFVNKNDKSRNDALDRIIWHSMPIVYPDYATEVPIIQKAMKARHKAKQRANKYILRMAQKFPALYFITFTWNQDTLENTSERTRHRYVQSWLKANTFDYLANVDFGKTTGREHYHAVVALKPIYEDWKFGFFQMKSVKMPRIDDRNDVYRLSSYLLKLSNHAGKVNTGAMFHPRQAKIEFEYLDEDEELPF